MMAHSCVKGQPSAVTCLGFWSTRLSPGRAHSPGRCVSPSRARLAAALCRQPRPAQPRRPSPAGGHGTATAEKPPLKTAATQTEITDCTCQSPTARTAAAQAAQGDFTSPFPSQKRTEVCSRHCGVFSALTYRCSASLPHQLVQT